MYLYNGFILFVKKQSLVTVAELCSSYGISLTSQQQRYTMYELPAKCSHKIYYLYMTAFKKQIKK